MDEHKFPTTLQEAIRYFSGADVCTSFVASLRWPEGPVCANCGGREHSYLTTRRIWKCKSCRKQFSVRTGTIFEDSPIPLDKWMAAIWLIAKPYRLQTRSAPPVGRVCRAVTSDQVTEVLELRRSK